MSKVESVLKGIVKLGVDTAPIIYFVETNPQYYALCDELFKEIDKGRIVGVTSVITLAEVLIHPFRLGNTSLQQQYRELLTDSANFEIQDIDIDIAEKAAELRARYRFLRTPDALQVSAALAAGCQVFLTNDISLKKITELQILVLEDLN